MDKKKGACRRLVLGHDTKDCIVTQQGTGTQGHAARRDMAGLRVGASNFARAGPGHVGVSRYKFCIVTGGSDMSCDTALCARDTALNARGMDSVSRYNFLYRDKGAATQRDSACLPAMTRQEAPATRQDGGHDTVPNAPRHGA